MHAITPSSHSQACLSGGWRLLRSCGSALLSGVPRHGARKDTSHPRTAVRGRIRGDSRLMEASRSYVKLAARCAHPGRPALLLMHGFSSCGKSTVAFDLVQALGSIWLRSDVERKRLRGAQAASLSTNEVAGGLYGQDFTVATYARLAEAAGIIAKAGYTAVVDAKFLRRWQRAQFQEVAALLGVPLALIDDRLRKAFCATELRAEPRQGATLRGDRRRSGASDRDFRTSCAGEKLRVFNEVASEPPATSFGNVLRFLEEDLVH